MGVASETIERVCIQWAVKARCTMIPFRVCRSDGWRNRVSDRSVCHHLTRNRLKKKKEEECSVRVFSASHTILFFRMFLKYEFRHCQLRSALTKIHITWCDKSKNIYKYLTLCDLIVTLIYCDIHSEGMTIYVPTSITAIPRSFNLTPFDIYLQKNIEW